MIILYVHINYLNLSHYMYFVFYYYYKIIVNKSISWYSEINTHSSIGNSSLNKNCFFTLYITRSDKPMSENHINSLHYKRLQFDLTDYSTEGFCQPILLMSYSVLIATGAINCYLLSSQPTMEGTAYHIIAYKQK